MAYMWTWCKKCMERTGHQYVEQLRGWVCVGCITVNYDVKPETHTERIMTTLEEARSLVEVHGNGISQDMTTADIFAYYSQYCGQSEIVDAAVFVTERGMHDDTSET